MYIKKNIMEFVLALPLVLVPLFIPVLTGLMAKTFGRKFWPWFFIGIPLPLVGCIILLCLPEKKKVPVVPKPRQNANLFDNRFSGN